MISNWIRVINGSSDESIDNASESTSVVTDGTTIILAKKAAFNNFNIWMDVLNTESLSFALSYWDGDEWQPVVDLLDGTKGLTKSGVVQFTPNHNHRWDRIDDTSDNGPAELSAFTFYDVYAVRIVFTGTPTVGTSIKKISYKFCEDQDLTALDSDLNEFLGSFNQTDWTSQILTASLEVVTDLKKKKVIKDAGNVLLLGDVVQPTAYKTLFLIYLSLGESYKDRREEIKKLYYGAFSGIYTIDKNNDGQISSNEFSVNAGRMFR